MPTPTDSQTSSVGELLARMAGDLATVEAGKDTGLLALYSYAMELAQVCSRPESPEAIRAAAALPREWLDKLLDTTAVFDQPTIGWLGKWQGWFTSAFGCWKQARPLPALPADWNPQDTVAAAEPAPAAIVSEDEPALILNGEADHDLLSEFINESQEHLQNIENGVLVLEENPADADTLNSIFRAFHTFKGGSGFLNLTPIKNLAHELESLLDAARQNKLTIDSPIIDVILQGGDTLKTFVAQIGAQISGSAPASPIVVPTLQLIARVQAILAAPADESAPVEKIPAAPAPAAEVVKPAAASHPPDTGAKPVAKVNAEPEPILDFTPLAAPAVQTATPAIVPAAEKPKANSAPAPAAATAAGFVKVDTTKLDSLIDLVGELVISESMVVQDPELLALPSRNLARNLAQLRRITSELQRTAMSLRMVPIKATFQKMTRLVRDLAAAQHKQVQLVFTGEDTELDRNIVEELSDPLVHMIRNSADHGVEMPDVRVAKGKPALGTVQLRAFHQGGNIVIQIKDDGAGLNKERILAKAIEKGIVKPGDSLPDKDIFALIFAAGFSTAEKITDLSGRGVGMDVVRRNIEKLRGKIDIESVAGQGTTFSIYLPLTLAIIDGMIVSVGGERYIIPTLAVRESFRPRAEMISTLHERGEMVNVRGRLCPLLRLYRYFDQPTKITEPTDGIVVVVESGDQTRCLMVDALIGKQEVVIKSLGGALKKSPSLAGGAVLGDGRVGLILNVDALVKMNTAVSLAA